MNKIIKQLFICFTILLSSISFYSCNKQDTYYESYTFEYGKDFKLIESNSIDFVKDKLNRYGNYGYKTGHPYFMSNWLPSITKYFDYEYYKNDKNQTFLLIVRKETAKYDVKYSNLKGEKINKAESYTRYTINTIKTKEKELEAECIFVDVVVIEKNFSNLKTVYLL